MFVCELVGRDPKKIIIKTRSGMRLHYARAFGPNLNVFDLIGPLSLYMLRLITLSTSTSTWYFQLHFFNS